MTKSTDRKYLKLLLVIGAIFTPPLVFFGAGLSQASALSIFTTIIILWFTELLPLPVTGLLVPVLATLYGILPTADAFKEFGNPILFLFIGAFLLAQALHKYKWDQRMAYFILASKVGKASPATLISIIGLICWTLSMWISNTATCAMMTPLCLGIAEIYNSRFKSEKEKNNFTTRILLTCAFSSSIGGLATPIGSPPNLIAISFLSEAGIQINFFEWMLLATPVALLMFLILVVILELLFPIKIAASNQVKEFFKDQYQALGPLTREEIQVALVFTFTVVFWILPGIVEQAGLSELYTTLRLDRLSMNLVGLIGGLSLFLLPSSSSSKDLTNLTWNDAKKIDWGTLMLFGGGLTLGAVLNDSGLAKEIGSLIFSGDNSFIYLLFASTVIGVLMSEFASNTASASVVIPIVIASVAGISENYLWFLVAAVAFGASYGFMLPVSTPPNAIVFGTGKLKIKDLIKAGIFFDIAGTISIVTYLYLCWIFFV
ncbi:MAG: DASS family sodium-coupled anion symporter [Bdellovibrionota bacterium]